MSNRLKPITPPEGVTVDRNGRMITVKKGQDEISFMVPKSGNLAADAGTERSLTVNAITGLTTGYKKILEIVGTGYRAAIKDKGIELFLGYSHSVFFTAPDGIKLEVKDNRLIEVSGRDKALVGQTAAKIRDFRRPDAYKGKGVRYQGESLKLKPGKAAKTGTEG